MEEKIKYWIKNNINDISIPLYMNCFQFNCKKVQEYLIDLLSKKFNVNENIIINICNNTTYIKDYVNKYQPKSFKDYIGITLQKLTQEVQKELVLWIKNNIETLINDFNWPKNDDTGLYDVNYIPDFKEYFFDADNFDIIPIIKKIIPEYRKLRYVNFDVSQIYTKFKWDNTFIRILNILLEYIQNENLKINNIISKHRKEIILLEDNHVKEPFITWDPQTVYLRDAPIVVIHDFKNDDDHVLIGRYGQHHNNLLRQYPDLYTNCRDENGKEVVTYAYLHGLIAILSTNEYNGYNSLQEVANIIKEKESNVLKVYLSVAPPRQSGKLTQLARLMKRCRR